MSSRPEFIERVIERPAPLDVSARATLGEYGLYHRGQNVALVCNDALYVTVTPAGEAIAGRVVRVRLPRGEVRRHGLGGPTRRPRVGRRARRRDERRSGLEAATGPAVACAR